MQDFKIARMRARLTQAELAERANVSKALVSFTERGATPGLRSQRAMAEALGVDAESLWPTPSGVAV